MKGDDENYTENLNATEINQGKMYGMLLWSG